MTDHPKAPTDSGNPKGESMSEEAKGRGVFWRAMFYIAGTHFLLGFLALLFYLGEHANK